MQTREHNADSLLEPILQRLRIPLCVLLAGYAITLDSTLKPWAPLATYLGLAGWAYVVANLAGLRTDPNFREALTRQRFAARIRDRTAPFYIVCGYGDIGNALVRCFGEHRVDAVVIDIESSVFANGERTQQEGPLLTMVADATLPAELLRAGLRHPCCAGVAAVTGSDEANIAIAMRVALLSAGTRVLCKADVAAGVRLSPQASVIDFDEILAAQTVLAIDRPHTAQLQSFLRHRSGQPLPSMIAPPRGRWILYGDSQFGRAVERYLRLVDIIPIIIEPAATALGAAARDLAGDIAALNAAGIEHAVGFIASTDSDISNIAICLTARGLNPKIFLIARHCLAQHRALFRAASINLVMDTAAVISDYIAAEFVNPLRNRFVSLIEQCDDTRANLLCTHLRVLTDGLTPEVWEVGLTASEAPAVHAALEDEHPLTLRLLCRDPQAREQSMACVPLLIARDGKFTATPSAQHKLAINDRILFAGASGTAQRMDWILSAVNVLHYAEGGAEAPNAALFRWWARRRLTDH
jgi:voltage-gated potassium channel